MNALRWIWDTFRDFRARLLLCNILFILEQFAVIAAQGSQKFLIDDVFVGQHYEKISWIMTYFVLTYMFSYLFNFFAQYYTKTNQLLVHREMGQSLMKNILQKPIAVIYNKRTAKWVQYFTSDTQQASSFITTTFSKGVQQSASGLFLLVIIAWANPVLFAITLFFSAIYIALGRYFGPIMNKQSRKIQNRRGEVLVNLEEGIASTREVIAYNRDEWEFNRFSKTFAKLYRKVMENGKVANTQLLLSNAVQWSGRISILVFGGYSVMNDRMTLGTFVIVYQYSNQFFNVSQLVYNFFINMSGQLAFIERIKALFEKEITPNGTIPLIESVNSIQLTNLKFSYSEEHKEVLSGLNLQFPCNRKVAIVGTSGGGKSTIAQLLLRLYNPNSGDILINGLPLSDIRASDWLSKVSVVFQEPFLLPESIRDNLLLGRDIPLSKVVEACKVAQIHDFIFSLENGYDTVLGERGYSLSGGQRQRIAIARAIVGDPEILILDEATSALDVETERQLQEGLDEIRKGKTTLVIAHRLSTIRNADTIYVMDRGLLAEQGNHEELMARGGIYPKLALSKGEMR